MCLSTDEWIKRRWYVHTMEYYPAYGWFILHHEWTLETLRILHEASVDVCHLMSVPYYGYFLDSQELSVGWMKNTLLMSGLSPRAVRGKSCQHVWSVPGLLHLWFPSLQCVTLGVWASLWCSIKSHHIGLTGPLHIARPGRDNQEAQDHCHIPQPSSSPLCSVVQRNK